MDNNFEIWEKSDIFSASEARKITDKAREEDIECLKPIMKKIRENAQKKDYHCYISSSTPKYVITKLENLGYDIKLIKGDFRNPLDQDIYKISW